ncbi:MAG: TlyA family RNA methyltransferase [Clostridiales bacterium]|nr:TlyA family RNA methyltransferase [Candidatus Crickella caballi]
MKERLDVLLVNNGFAESREKAKRTIMAGLVMVNGRLEDKPGSTFDVESEITVKGKECPYVSRGGLKLEKAIKEWGVDCEGKHCIDMGASTGGFTDCMLQHGAQKVYAIDVGYGQLAYKLREDPRVINLEKTNIRYLDLDLIEEPIDLISIDVSFISVKHMLPVAAAVMAPGAKILCLVKPQFEAGKEQVGKGGIVRDPAVHREVIENVISYAESSNLYPCELTFSPIKGTKGNIEYLLLLSNEKCDNKLDIDSVVNASHKDL